MFRQLRRSTGVGIVKHYSCDVCGADMGASTTQPMADARVNVGFSDGPPLVALVTIAVMHDGKNTYPDLCKTHRDALIAVLRDGRVGPGVQLMGRSGMRQAVVSRHRGMLVKERSSTRGGGRRWWLLTLECGHQVQRRDAGRRANCGSCGTATEHTNNGN